MRAAGKRRRVRARERDGLCRWMTPSGGVAVPLPPELDNTTAELLARLWGWISGCHAGGGGYTGVELMTANRYEHTGDYYQGRLRAQEKRGKEEEERRRGRRRRKCWTFSNKHWLTSCCLLINPLPLSSVRRLTFHVKCESAPSYKKENQGPIPCETVSATQQSSGPAV